MPLENAEDIGMETAEGAVCVHDSENGAIKEPEQIFEGGVQWYMHAVADCSRELAARLTTKNMNSLPYWQKHPATCLGGPEATDDEYQVAMAKL